MRTNAIGRAMAVAITAGTTVVSGRLGAQEHGSRPPDVGAGRIAWFDLTTSNLRRSRDFYGKLFDWSFAAVKGTDQAVEIVAGRTGIGTLRVADGKLAASNGVVYVQVADMRAACRRAAELGGTVSPGFPFDLPDGAGAVAVVLDPVGHPVGMYSRAPLAAAAPPR
jgi:predicted enzyme related to lactoylglutathione lyase